MSWPKIVSRRATRVSPWVEIVERGVEFKTGGTVEKYHAVAQRDYVAIVARTPDGKFPLVRQFRPAVEKFTWEFPAGTVEQGEPPEDSCRRELLEETGYPAHTIYPLGGYAPCTARLSNTIHSFFVETGPRAGNAEEGIEVKPATPHELASLILSGDFTLQLHVGALLLAVLRGHLDIAAFR
ncbi:MAG TPA: NUDIX hydrolase [Pseudolabrys sp.]|jgi:8-oxo-dGTP pyrophosphatase MutT (NUDIX family)